ncbi:F-box/LRR-repeat protein 4-like [Ctenocephalides felis]|uniref:F-box/LRR-repeat protein 4-like n=1 Tax=Ctenocephalides felis TaxID=7515 RepID=UPI000E6E49E5|nr:F-box/LRR-repeat protein 4-like [Ctenocephalides felis]
MDDISDSEGSLYDNSEENSYIIEQFVLAVTDFSSQYGSDISVSYTAYNICGKPSKFPDYGDFSQSFVMRTYGKWWNLAPSRLEPFMPQNEGNIVSEDFIEILYETSVYPICVSLFEIYNPGALVRIWASQPEGCWSLLWEGKPEIIGHKPRMFTPPIQTTKYPTKLLRLEFNQSHLEYYTELDAVLLTGSKLPLNSQNVDVKEEKSISTIGNGQLVSAICKMSLHENLIEDEDKIHELQKVVNDYKSSLKSKEKKRNLGMISCLPDETILKILGYLDLISLFRCSQTSSYLYLLCTDPMLYTVLGLKPYWHYLNVEALQTLSVRSKLLQKLDLSWCGSYGSFKEEHFTKFLKNCGRYLIDLRLNTCKFVSNDTCLSISQYCSNIKEICLRNCANINSVGFQKLAKLRNLERLDLYRTNIETLQLLEILKHNKNLKHLNLGSCAHVSNLDEIMRQLSITNQSLISLDLWKGYSITSVGVRFLSRISSLEEIDLSWCMGIGEPGDSLHCLAKGCPKLKNCF